MASGNPQGDLYLAGHRRGHGLDPPVIVGGHKANPARVALGTTRETMHMVLSKVLREPATPRQGGSGNPAGGHAFDLVLSSGGHQKGPAEEALGDHREGHVSDHLAITEEDRRSPPEWF